MPGFDNVEEEALDPIGVSRDPTDDRLIMIPGENVRVTYEKALRWFNMTAEERLEDLLTVGRRESSLSVAG